MSVDSASKTEVYDFESQVGIANRAFWVRGTCEKVEKAATATSGRRQADDKTTGERLAQGGWAGWVFGSGIYVWVRVMGSCRASEPNEGVGM